MFNFIYRDIFLFLFQIPVVADLPVGENFQDHCGPSLFFELDPSISDLNKKLANTTNVQEYIKHRKGQKVNCVINRLMKQR